MKRLNVVVRCCKKHKCGIFPEKLQGELRIVAVSDAAYKSTPDE